MNKRTQTVELPEDQPEFSLEIDICKAEQLGGRRIIRGVASGLLEDLDGERMSRHAVEDMARQAVKGLKLVAGRHDDQDWYTEIGDVIKVEHDPEHDELLVDTELPPEGEDALADKAWTRLTKRGERLGFSVGGKLRKAFYETTETGKRRKVLDEVGLRHFVLTKKPAYTQSFAEAVAKTFTGEPPADDAFTLDGEDEPDTVITVEKDASATSQDRDSGGYGGKKDPKAKLDVSGEDDKKDGDDDETTPADKLPKARRLACPNCGHEFAADMPADTEPPADGGDTEREARKTAPKEDDMDPKDALKELRGLVSGEEAGERVEKTEAEVEAEVEKREPEEKETLDIGKTVESLEQMIATSHATNHTATEELGKAVKEGFELVAKSHKQLVELIGSTPAGRAAIARVKAGNGEGTPTRAEAEAGEVGKTATDEVTVAKTVEKLDDPIAALAVLNRAGYGVESNIADQALAA